MEILGCFSVMKIKAPPPPLSLSGFGNLRIGQKSALLTCIEFGVQKKLTYQFDSKIFDGSAVVHFLPTGSAITFAMKFSFPFLFTSWKTQTGLIVSGMVILIAASRS